jgi:crotonobetainyl-CoA:carnitine CoA-transferase CaiB-like acyl-CoA transferase
VPPSIGGNSSLFFETFNRNKRSIALDLDEPTDRGIFEDLVRVSDAVYANLRGDVPAKLEVRYDDLAHINPRIVCCSLSAFGMTGPRAAQPGYDYILQGLAGWMDLTGEPDGPPSKTGLSLVDFSGGFVAALALVAGIHAARRDGKGMDCDVSLFETAVSLLTYLATWHLNDGPEPRRTRHSAHPSLVPFRNFPTADGWIVVACPKEKFWRSLTAAIDRVDLADDPRFSDFAQRYAHQAELDAILEEIFRSRPSRDWLSVLADAGVPCGPVNSVSEALRDPQVAARGLIVETQHDDFGTVQQLASPVRVGDPPERYRRAPFHHEDAQYVLRDVLGYDEQQLRALEEARAAGGALTP